jgi:hypothetical protein
MSKEFVYNDNEVCANPNELLIMEKPKDWSQPFFLVETAICNGRWIFGYTVHLNNLGLGEPCMYRPSKRTFNTEIGAVNEAIDEIRAFALKNPTATSPSEPNKIISAYSKKFLALIDEVRRPKVEQLNLFD